ncbi:MULTISPECIES: hypothetical protein [Bacillus cereus group]|uniref:Uncharacterized protein n=1 Tax=Bacillus thuringiensis serovar mexicanensis TaxID=180868 RepID=A0A242WBW1_BACTU|nr:MULTISPECIES: hypothetical protein [Bacillus cereus group]EEM56267.1 hypothetical protein bthur0007_58870 [Bacillus thuringiensis serovar monterrey BGSC 4AJ1]MEB9673958.1 hypothetical protein [Bacillus anthracis]OTW50859.1 hypothetical protein BK699_09955 [Bacillus thuringiensis serovar mexicanensis]OTX09544.1 hypothetical protein BK705_05000 [Bacillus thuringiensis serovar monterrey]
MEHKHNKEHGKWIQKQNDILKNIEEHRSQYTDMDILKCFMDFYNTIREMQKHNTSPMLELFQIRAAGFEQICKENINEFMTLYRSLMDLISDGDFEKSIEYVTIINNRPVHISEGKDGKINVLEEQVNRMSRN